jgi:hypothetical protein
MCLDGFVKTHDCDAGFSIEFRVEGILKEVGGYVVPKVALAGGGGGGGGGGCEGVSL